MDEFNSTRFLTVEEIASLLRKKERTIREWCYNQSIPHYKVGNSLLFKKYEILEWIDKNYRVEICESLNGMEETLNEQSVNGRPPRLKVENN